MAEDSSHEETNYTEQYEKSDTVLDLLMFGYAPMDASPQSPRKASTVSGGGQEEHKERMRALTETLCRACSRNDRERVKSLLAHENVAAFINEKDREGYCALYHAVYFGSVEAVQDVCGVIESHSFRVSIFSYPILFIFVDCFLLLLAMWMLCRSLTA
jgi:hypothetical protein